MLCSNCGKEFNDDFEFCPYCGEEAPSIMICTNCGFESLEYSFCPKCGFQLLTKDEINNERNIALNQIVNEFKETKEDYDNLQKVNLKKQAESYYNKSIELEQINKYNDAITYCKKAIKLDPKNSEYRNKLKEVEDYKYIKSKIKEGQNQYKIYLQLKKEIPIKSLAHKHSALRAFARAEHYCEKAIKLNPTNAKYRDALRICREWYTTIR